MNPLDRLKSCAGSWQGKNRLHDPHTNAPDDSPSSLQVSPLLSGKFVRLQYTWQYQGTPQEGVLLAGYEADADIIKAYWIDSWHMGDKLLTLSGKPLKDNKIDLRGSYAAPPDPDWGWRIMIAIGEAQGLQILMYNVTPDGQEAPAVEAGYART